MNIEWPIFREAVLFQAEITRGNGHDLYPIPLNQTLHIPHDHESVGWVHLHFLAHS